MCIDGFNHDLVNAICSNLGYKKTDKNKWTTAQGWDIRYNYDIKLGNFNCRDDNWSSCSYNTQPWDCSHEKDALLFCKLVRKYKLTWIVAYFRTPIFGPPVLV